MIEKLKSHVPSNVIAELPLVFNRFKIDTPLRLSHFLAQCDHESGGFKVVNENLNYSKEGLLKIFPKYFNDKTATESARQPQKIANRVYAKRMGNINANDGWTFRGRGYIQLTGFNNYNAFDTVVDDEIVKNPDLVATKYPLLSAAWFWFTNKINNIADLGIDRKTMEAVRRKVNGGLIGIDDTVKKTEKYWNILK